MYKCIYTYTRIYFCHSSRVCQTLSNLIIWLVLSFIYLIIVFIYNDLFKYRPHVVSTTCSQEMVTHLNTEPTHHGLTSVIYQELRFTVCLDSSKSSSILSQLIQIINSETARNQFWLKKQHTTEIRKTKNDTSENYWSWRLRELY